MIDREINFTVSSSPLSQQVGGNHYKDCKIQPTEYIHANQLPFIEGCIVKYATRHKKKNGAEDVRKIIHYAKILLKLEYKLSDDEIAAL